MRRRVYGRVFFSIWARWRLTYRRENDADRYFEACLRLDLSAEQREDIGRYFQRVKQPEKAEEQYRKAVEIRSNAFGPESPQAALGYYTLAQFYEAQGKVAQAVEYDDRVVKIYDAASAGDSIEAFYARNLLANIYDREGKFADEGEVKRTFGARDKPHRIQLN